MPKGVAINQVPCFLHRMPQTTRKSRIAPFLDDPLFANLSEENRQFLTGKADSLYLSFQDIRQLIIIATDLEMWGQGSMARHWDETDTEHLNIKLKKSRIVQGIHEIWQALKEESPRYTKKQKVDSGESGSCHNQGGVQPTLITRKTNGRVLGQCPVASEKTRCCGLQTLDAVMNCGYDCSYCSIQSFYYDNRIYFHEDLGERIKRVEPELDPDKLYHIGTGQSSDSLLWGNRNGILDDLLAFARRNPNVILEFKTKSANIRYLMENPVPSNVITTWSLNPDLIVENEEHGTAPLTARLGAAEKLAKKGCILGFHFHPIILFQDWKAHYAALFEKVTERFDPAQVALVSFGTLTYIKPVMQQLRQRKQKSKILQMPLEQVAGKFSYPMSVKRDLFRFAYEAFGKWHNKVFFYLCMEPAELWEPTFGFDYSDNEAFEQAMKSAYIEKIKGM